MNTYPRKRSRLGIAVLAVAVLALLLAAGPALASEEIAQAEGGLTCTVCHDKPGSKLYTDKGKYYELMGTLDGFEEILAVFQKCTTCHVRKPGSEKLTSEGRRFAGLMDDMTDLKSWVQSSHPPIRAEDIEEAMDRGVEETTGDSEDEDPEGDDPEGD